MNGNFSYYNPTKLYFGKNSIECLETELLQQGKNILLVYGGGSIKKNGIYQQVLHTLETLDKNVFEISSRNHTENMSESRGLGFLYVDERYSQTGGLFDNGSIGHCGHTGQSLFVDLYSGLYVIILSDATLSVFKKLKEHNYNEVMKMRENIHRAIKLDLLDIDVKKVGN